MGKFGSKINELVFQSVSKLFFLIYSLVCIYPFYYIFIYSISHPNEVQRYNIYFLPVKPTYLNYVKVFEYANIANAFLVSCARAITGMLVTVLCCSLFAYLLTKEEIIGRKIIYKFLIMTMYLNAGLIPWYMTMRTYGLKNNFLLYILPYAVNAYYIMLLKTFFEQIPISLEESAKLDGAGYLTIFFKIIIPLSPPIIATIAVFSCVFQWNAWTDNLFLVSKSNLQTLQKILLEYLKQAQNIANQSSQGMESGDLAAQSYLITAQSVKMTVTMMAAIPILLVYPMMQKYYIKGIMLGAVKG